MKLIAPNLIIPAMIWLAVLVALITAATVLIYSGRYEGTALLKLEIGERYKVKACVGHESSDEKKGSSFCLMLLEDHKGTVRYYKISKEKLPEISVEDAIILMTNGAIHNLTTQQGV